MTAYVAINGEPATSVELIVPPVGAWYADVDLEVDPDVSGRVMLEVGDLRLSGTVATANDGTRGIQRKTRIVGGAGGWGTLVAAKAYHADNGVSARLVADEAARVAGETITEWAPGASTLGADYVRSTGPAARVLEDVIGSARWWVDYDGNTHVGTRSSSSPSVDYQVLEYHPRNRRVVLATESFADIVIGSVLSRDLDESQTVRELRIVANEEHARVYAWTGGVESTRGHLADAFAGAVARLSSQRLFGPWRYRVVRMSTDRVELQAVRRDAGLPDISPVSQWPGMAGMWAQLSPGAEVLVQFVEGDRTMPVLTHFAGKGGNGWAPVSLVLDATTDIKLGASASQFVARIGDEIEVTFDPNTFMTSAQAAVYNAAPLTFTGTITSGSSKVKAQ